jgi:peptide/nickel transport system permease protein
LTSSQAASGPESEVRSAPVPSYPERRRGSGLAEALRSTGVAGIVVALTLVLAIVGPWITPEDPLTIHPDKQDLPPFSSGHLLGTDSFGRDVLSRAIVGARLSLTIGLVPVVIAGIIGLLLGLLAAFGPRAMGFGIMRLADVALAFPSILLAIAVAAMLGPSVNNALLALTIVLVPAISRIARAAALEVESRPYIDAARMSGASRRRIVLDFGIPNMIAPVLIYAATLCGIIIIFAAGLSFLGVGVQPPRAEWGLMVAEGRSTFLINPWPSLIPGACIFVVGLAFSLSADRLRDHFDPRMS